MSLFSCFCVNQLEESLGSLLKLESWASFGLLAVVLAVFIGLGGLLSMPPHACPPGAPSCLAKQPWVVAGDSSNQPRLLMFLLEQGASLPAASRLFWQRVKQLLEQLTKCC